MFTNALSSNYTIQTPFLQNTTKTTSYWVTFKLGSVQISSQLFQKQSVNLCSPYGCNSYKTWSAYNIRIARCRLSAFLQFSFVFGAKCFTNWVNIKANKPNDLSTWVFGFDHNRSKNHQCIIPIGNVQHSLFSAIADIKLRGWVLYTYNTKVHPFTVQMHMSQGTVPLKIRMLSLIVTRYVIAVI